MKTSNTPTDSHTLRNERRDFPEWHLGRRYYGLWALEVDTVEVRQRMQDVQAHLAQYLLEGYRRQPHITVGLCGFLSEAPHYADDFGPQTLREQLAALRQTRPVSFRLRVGELDSFTSVPYLTVRADAGHLETLRRCLAGADMNASDDQYMPHVTVGLYAGVWPLSDVRAQFSHFSHAQASHLDVRSISLVSYTASEIGGPLQTLAVYDFESGVLRWNSTLPTALRPFATVTEAV